MIHNTQSPHSRFHVMAKPIGPICNLDCSYCFYLHKEDMLSTTNKWRVSEEVFENFIKQYIQVQNFQEVVFSWQGGEPTQAITWPLISVTRYLEKNPDIVEAYKSLVNEDLAFKIKKLIQTADTSKVLESLRRGSTKSIK